MRPKVPLISKRKVCETALRMIDSHGIDNFSVRGLANEVGVNAASFYHHFDNKEAILAGAAQLALAEVRTPAAETEDWQVWFLRNTQTLHKVLQRHPELIEVVLRRNLFRLGLTEIEKTYALLERQGLPITLVVVLMESLESFVAGQVMLERFAAADRALDADEFPTVKRAYAARQMTPEAAFELGCRKIIEGIAEQGRLDALPTGGGTDAPPMPARKRPSRARGKSVVEAHAAPARPARAAKAGTAR